MFYRSASIFVSEPLSGLEHSGLRVIGSNSSYELVDLLAHPEGGFLVAGNSRFGRNLQIQVCKYPDDCNLEWTKRFGSDLDNKLFKLFLDRHNNFVITGLSYGFEDDNDEFYGRLDTIPA